MIDALGYYKVLDVREDADIETIKTAYRNKAKLWHPDSNQSPEAIDVFRHLSEAYDVLSDEKSRCYYDILSLVCNAKNYPDIKNLALAKDKNEDVNLRIVAQFVNKSNFLSYSSKKEISAWSYIDALRLNFRNSLTNWLCGWWHIKTFGKNLSAIVYNFGHPIDKAESLRMLLINMLVHAQEGRADKAAQCGWQACDYLKSGEIKRVKSFIENLHVSAQRPHRWKMYKMYLAQLIIPLAAVVLFSGIYVINHGYLYDLLLSKESINYYQSVRVGNNEQLTDDVVVGRIINIPVDKSDASKLYHLQKESLIMYGPSEKFDVLKKAAADTTVRLTGMTPDNVWARVMIDNGEMGFVRFKDIKQGKGAEIPFGSKIVE